jgi:hypothetical protein
MLFIYYHKVLETKGPSLYKCFKPFDMVFDGFGKLYLIVDHVGRWSCIVGTYQQVSHSWRGKNMES